MLTVNRGKLTMAAYAYLLVPIIIFFWGWLKPAIAAACTLLLAAGYWEIYKKEKMRALHYSIPYKMIVFLAFSIILWMLMSGAGGYFSLQRGDLHWRNATFRDLVEYSWPVVYPETGNALVYYFIFWMVPAWMGKVFGYAFGNAVLFFWIFLGIFIMALYMCISLGIKTAKDMSVFIFVLVTWGGLNILGQLMAYIVKGNVVDWIIYFVWTAAFTPGLQYTPNNALLEWCFNQVIVPWLVIAMFLEDGKKSVDKLAYLGFWDYVYCHMHPSPFVGL